MEKTNKQVGGTHYEVLSIQPVELFGYYGLSWFKAEPIKYLSRYRNKNGIQDLMKAYHILGMPSNLNLYQTHSFRDIFRYDVYDEQSNKMYIKYINQFKDGYFIEPNSWFIFKNIILDILNCNFSEAKKKVGLLIYSEYDEKIN